MNKIIAVVGMTGSGKSIGSEYLESIGFQKVYFGGITMDILKEKNISVTPDNEKIEREALRKEYGMGAYAILSLPKIEKYLQSGNVVIDGLYSWEELMILQEKFPLMQTIAVVVDKNVRYSRLEKREIRSLTKEQAKTRDKAEIENLAKGGPIAFADYFIYNNGSLDDYLNRLNEILKCIERS